MASFIQNLHRDAQVFFRDYLSAEGQLSVLNLFKTLDADGSGSISETELLNYCASAEFSPELSHIVHKLLPLLDVDGNGSLDFTECITLHYFVTSYKILWCGHCGEFIPGSGYGCEDCRKLEDPTGFNLCSECYPSKIPTHNHANFLPHGVIYENKLASHGAQVQCVVCGDFHRKDSVSIFSTGAGGHIVLFPGSSDNYVCEWCFTWACSNCGQFAQGPPSQAVPGKWLSKDLRHSECPPAGSGKQCLAEFLESIKTSKLLETCSTCRIKINNGTLWSSVAARASQSTTINAAPRSTNREVVNTGLKLAHTSLKVAHGCLKVADTISTVASCSIM